ncbi:pyridoxal-phosphate dependent enzyme [Paeniclostridium sordellii]|uniref:1-aminocyclopropane-1-carboxylate deaminase/D-cysteine desulfhydrase n=1 Tax=Paraclostridium sordellii TaxID=1505 RepID=UPI00214A1528|nr:pyridoxal-phosphate dependent enzyme [Paeniclostridium sordellii]MCR1849925.1 pyridoxal-phosphate dependent enzyme [Paeniclostridium sordellii]
MIKITPIQKISDINKNNIYIKREDLIDIAFGGNKARKINYFAKDIVSKNCDYIVTYGSSQSNHCRVTAAIASKLGLKCLLILADDGKDDYNGNYFLYDLFGAKSIIIDVNNVNKTIDETMANLKDKGHKPYFISGGGHGNLGTQAYIDAYKEIKIQSKEKNLDFDYIFFASGTGTTHAGLIVGNKLNKDKTEVIGISIARRNKRGKQVILESVKEYTSENKIDFKITTEDIKFIDSYIGNGYADIYQDIINTIKQVAKNDNILLDPVYTGKAFYGMKDFLEKNNIMNKNILFIHTGGIPLLFKYADRFK